MFSAGSSRSDSDLLFLTDSAYVSLLDQDRSIGRSSKGKQKQDGLFLERLDSFIEGQLRDMEAFAIRKLVAIPHAKFLFSQDPTLPSSSSSTPQPANDSGMPSIRSVLSNLSNILQALHKTAGLDSLLLVVSPTSYPSPSNAQAANDGAPTQNGPPKSASEASWIGGTELGKEFWTGLKGGGVNGARAFRVKCHLRHEAEEKDKEIEESAPVSSAIPQPGQASLTDSAKTRSGKVNSNDVKTELNSAVRQALRAASGNPSAEMRWTKPASLEDLYSVRLVGWPPTVKLRNPSNNTVKENGLLLGLVRSEKMKFIKKDSPEWGYAGSAALQVTDTATDGGLKQSDNSRSKNGGTSTQALQTSQAEGVQTPASVASEIASQIAPLDTSTGQNSRAPSSQVPIENNSPGVGDEAPRKETQKRHVEDNDELLEMQDSRKRSRLNDEGDGQR